MAKKSSKTVQKTLDALLATDHFDAAVREEIVGLGEAVLPTLQAYATGSCDNPDIQARAILMLGEIRKPMGKEKQDECVDVLGKCLHHPDSDMRIRAMMALGSARGAKATKMLADVLDHAECSCVEQTHCVRSLGQIKSKAARDVLDTVSRKRSLEKPVRDEAKSFLK